MNYLRAVNLLLLSLLQTVLLTLILVVSPSAHAKPSDDVLAVTDIRASTVTFYDARTGQYLSTPRVTAGTSGLSGPTGVIFDQRSNEVLVANQNVGQPYNGEILRYSAVDGHFIAALVSKNDDHAPYAPRGFVLVPDGHGASILFIADLGDVDPPNGSGPTGALLAFSVKGHTAKFIRNLDPNLERPGTTGPQFHPRGIVLGPDGLLYVTLRSLSENCGGGIVRFDPQRLAFKDVIVSNPVDCTQNRNDLHRPEGLVFGEHDDLYVTSFCQALPSQPPQCISNDPDKILIIPHATSLRGHPWFLYGRDRFDRIDLDRNQAHASAQALVFGPDGHLYVPVTLPDAGYGEVRRYNVITKGYWTFVPAGKGLTTPYYLSFGKTNPATLDYEGH